MRPERIARMVTSAIREAARKRTIVVSAGFMRFEIWGLTPELSRTAKRFGLNC